MKILKYIIPILVATLIVSGIVWAATFPGALNSFSTGDIIEAVDWNAIEATIGITSSASTTSLTYKVNNRPTYSYASSTYFQLSGGVITASSTFVNTLNIIGILTADGGILSTASSTFTATTTIENDFVVNQGGIDINLPADDNITIDGRTNPRTITMGAMRWNHTPDASTLNTRALFLDIDANSVPNTQGMHIDLKGTLIAAGETVIGINVVGDTADSTGGVLRLIELDKTGIGSAEVHGIHISPEIEEVIHHASGTFIDPTQGWDENGGFASTTHAFSSSTLNVTVFNANSDAIYIGADAVFQEVEIVLNTGASNPGIKPTFAISTAGAYTTIIPIDNTAGFRESGIIDLEDVDLSSWAATTTNSVSKFYLRITRTQGGLGTDPIETLIQTAAVTDYIWYGDGRLNINSIVSASSTLGTVTSGTWNGTAIDISSYTNLVAGTNISFSSDTLNVDDAFLLNTGDTGTELTLTYGLTAATSTWSGLITANGGLTGVGVYDFGGATSLEIPNSATLQTDVLGKIGIDSTSDQLRFYGSATRTIAYWEEKCLIMASSTWQNITTSTILWRPYKAIEIIQTSCDNGGTTIDQGTTTMYMTTSTDTTALDTATCGYTQSKDASLSNVLWAADEPMIWNLQSITGTPNFFNYCIVYIKTED